MAGRSGLRMVSELPQQFTVSGRAAVERSAISDRVYRMWRRRRSGANPDGKWKFVIAANGLERDRTTEEGRGVHCDEIAETQGGFFMDPKKREEVAAKLPKYKELKFPELD